MFHFYDPASFEPITCTPPTIQTMPHKKKLADLAFCPSHFENNLLDGTMMKALSCFLQWYLYTSKDDANRLLERIPQIDDPTRALLQKKLVALQKGASGSVGRSIILNDRLSVAIKRALSMSSLEDLIQEYFVGVYGLNHLRFLCPNFCYTFAIYHHHFSTRILMENIKGKTLIRHLQETCRLPFSVQSTTHFLQLWIQIILALEIAQETYGFTHFDLHGENVLIRSLPSAVPTLQYPIFDEVYRLDNITSLSTLIDFGHSTIRYKKGFFGKGGSNAFPQYGMYPFYIAGADLFKLLTYLWITLGYDSCTKTMITFAPDSMGSRYLLFFQFLLETFYGKQYWNPAKPGYVSPETIRQQFYDGTQYPSIYYSPFDMLQFLRVQQQQICRFLTIASYPWTIERVTPGYNYYSNLRYKYEQTHECFKSFFCHSIPTVPKDIFHLETTTTTTTSSSPGGATKDLKVFEALLKRKVPLLAYTSLPEIEAFLHPLSEWKAFESHLQSTITSLRKGKISQPHDFLSSLYSYRSYVTLLGYRSYFHQFYKL